MFLKKQLLSIFILVFIVISIHSVFGAGIIDRIQEGASEKSKEELKIIVTQIVNGDPNVLRYMPLNEMNLIIDACEQEVKRLNNEKEEDETFNIFDITSGKSLSAFLGGMNNRDPQVRLKSAAIVKTYILEEKDVYQKLSIIKKSIIDSYNSETVLEVAKKYESLLQYLDRVELISKIKASPALMSNLTPEAFKILFTGIEQGDIPPIASFTYKEVPILLLGLENRNFWIRLECANSLSILYSNEATPLEVKNQIAKAFAKQYNWAADIQLNYAGQLISQYESLLKTISNDEKQTQ